MGYGGKRKCPEFLAQFTKKALVFDKTINYPIGTDYRIARIDMAENGKIRYNILK